MVLLIKILTKPNSIIWAINVGESDKVTEWNKFASAITNTNITHLYVSEHLISPKLKQLFVKHIENNMKKHILYKDVSNYEVINNVTHMWKNPKHCIEYQMTYKRYIKDIYAGQFNKSIQSLYHRPSTIRAVHPRTKQLVSIGKGLFSKLSYTNNETIIIFCGDLMSQAQYEQETTAGRGGYAIHLSETEVLNCYHKFKQNKCMASYANSPQGCVIAGSKEKAKPNANLVVDRKNKSARIVANGNISPNTEILLTYRNAYRFPVFN